MTIRNSISELDRPREHGLRALIRRHPLVSFFILTNLLSWLAWTPYVLSLSGLGIWHYTFPSVLGTTQFAGMLPGAFLGPITSAFIVTALTTGKPGLREWASRLVRWRVNWKWYALAVLGVPAAIILTSLVFSGGQIQAPPAVVFAVFIPGLILQMLTTGLAEEPGWRDFAVPRLQSRYGALKGALVLGPLWALWHFPLFLTEWGGYPHSDWTKPLLFTVFCVAFTIVMSWVFNRTNQSLPVVMLMHVSVNNFMSIVWESVFPTIDPELAQIVLLTGTAIIAVVLLIATRGRLGYKPETELAPAQAVLEEQRA